MSLLLLYHPSREVKLINSPVNLDSSHQYRCSFKVWCDTNASIEYGFVDSSDGAQHTYGSQFIVAETWTTVTFTFTPTTTDNASRLVIHLPDDANTFRFDDANLLDLTSEQLSYRVMRIQGSMNPGSYVQTLTLREKTAAETA
jgi:hypothetical protein